MAKSATGSMVYVTQKSVTPLMLSSTSELCLSLPGWDSKSFAEILCQAAHGKFQALDVSRSETLLGLQNGGAAQLGRQPQKELYRVFLDILHEPTNRESLDATLKRRLINLYGPFKIDFANAVNLNSCMRSLDLISIPDKNQGHQNLAQWLGHHLSNQGRLQA